MILYGHGITLFRSWLVLRDDIEWCAWMSIKVVEVMGIRLMIVLLGGKIDVDETDLGMRSGGLTWLVVKVFVGGFVMAVWCRSESG